MHFWHAGQRRVNATTTIQIRAKLEYDSHQGQHVLRYTAVLPDCEYSMISTVRRLSELTT